MYALSKEQKESVEGWIKSLPDSMVKSNYQKWLADLKVKYQLSSAELEKFLSFSNGLPKGFANYPQEFTLLIKNKLNPEVKKEAKVETKKSTPVAKKSGK